MKLELLWEQLLGKGLEHLFLHQSKNIKVSSMAVGVVRDVPYRIQYEMVCDLNWNVKQLKVLDLFGEKEVHLSRDGKHWRDGMGNPIESFHGCTDVDIMVTPFTNTLPIRRLRLAQGDAKEISVIYVSIPDLGLTRLSQRYTCISQDSNDGIYKYENLSNGFTSEIKVDEDGMVVDYPGIFMLAWKRREPN